MKYLLKNRQIYSVCLLILTVAVFFSISIDSNFVNMYIRNFNVISIRYFFLIISIVIEYIVYNYFYSSTIVNRYKNRSKYFYHTFLVEIVLSFMLFAIFNIIILVYHIPISLNYIIDICITLTNLLVVYITASLFVKLIDIFIQNHIISCVVFLFLFVCTDFILDHFNFFFFNHSLISLSNIYTIYYSSKNSLVFLMFIILLDIVFFNFFNLHISRKDILIQKDAENE